MIFENYILNFIKNSDAKNYNEMTLITENKILKIHIM